MGDFTYRHARAIVIVTGLLLLASAPLAAAIFDRVEPFDISDPDSEVERAYDAYEEATGITPEPGVLLLVEPEGGADDIAGQRRLLDVAGELAEIEGIGAVSTPLDRPEQLSDDGQEALVAGFLEEGAGRVETGERVEDEFSGDPDVLAGGVAVAAHQIGVQTEEDTRRIELFAAPVLLLLLLLVFRSPVAAALPLALAAFSITLTLALLSVLSEIVDIDLFSLQVVTGLGVGLAIDYSLFVLARYRLEIRRNRGYEEAQARTIASAGRTVAYGALTVAAALAALIIFPQQFLSSTGISGALVALLSGATALIILPAMLALLRSRVDPGYAAAQPAGTPAPDPLGGGSRFWTGLAERVMARPVPIATVALLVMLAVAAPAIGGQLTTPDARVLPDERSARQVFDAVNERFEDLPAERIVVVVPPDADRVEIAPARDSIPTGSNPSFGPIRALADGSTYLEVRSDLDPLAERGQRLLERVRAAPWPEGTLIGGRAAELADQRSSVADHAAPVVAVVVLTNLLLVLLMVRSLVLPLVSIALNALTVAASYGVMVALFENETTAELLGTFAQDGIDVSVPILAFAVVFGLSTDYGIFLFSRIAEARRDGLGERAAITVGLARTGRLITSAAVIFAVAVGANVFSDLVIVKEFAVAVAVAVLLDATIVRGLLVPAVLRLLGSRAWWPGGRGAAAPAAPPERAASEGTSGSSG